MANHRAHPCCPRCTRAGRSGQDAADWHHDLRSDIGGIVVVAGVIVFAFAMIMWVLVQVVTS